MTDVHVSAEGDLLTIKVDMTEVARDLCRQVEHWQQTAERRQTQWEESEWYLGEAKASAARLEERLQAVLDASEQVEASHREMAARLQEAERPRDEASAHLEELRTAHDGLRGQAAQLAEQLAQAQGDVEEMRRLAEVSQHQLAVERAERKAVEADLVAARTGERRRALRTFRPDVTVEFQSPDGTVLFRGVPRNVSPAGVGFASEQPISDASGMMWVTLHLSGVERPIDAIGRLAWQGQEATMVGYVGGCELVEMAPGCRETFEQTRASAA